MIHVDLWSRTYEIPWRWVALEGLAVFLIKGKKFDSVYNPIWFSTLKAAFSLRCPFSFRLEMIISTVIVDIRKLNVCVVKSGKLQFVNFPPKHAHVVTYDFQVPMTAANCCRASGSSGTGGSWMNPLLEGLLVSTNALAHNAKIFDKGIKSQLRFLVFVSLHAHETCPDFFVF